MHLFTVFGIIILLSAACFSKRKWNFELVSVFSNTTDKSILEFDMKTQRVSRDVLGLSGVWRWNFDVDNTTMFELITYTSYNGIESDYELLPYQIRKTTYNDFLKKFYSEMFYSNFKHCSTLPVFKNEEETPWKKGVYKFDRCVPTANGTPDVMPDSYYKIFFIVSGQAEAQLVLIFKVAMQLY